MTKCFDFLECDDPKRCADEGVCWRHEAEQRPTPSPETTMAPDPTKPAEPKLKTIKCGVSCEYWHRSIKFDVKVSEDSTDEEIEEAIREAAIEEAGFEYWREDGDD